MNSKEIKQIEDAFKSLMVKFERAELDTIIKDKLVYWFKVNGDYASLDEINEMAKKYQIITV